MSEQLWRLAEKSASVDLAAIERKIERALNVVDRDAADNLIGKDGKQLDRDLLAAVQAQHQLLYGMVVNVHSAKDAPTQTTLETIAKHQLVMFQIVHNAFAAGIKHERDRNGASSADKRKKR